MYRVLNREKLTHVAGAEERPKRGGGQAVRDRS
jgi:hypothetical protein